MTDGRIGRQHGHGAHSVGGCGLLLPVLATVAIVAPLAWMWQASRMPAAYSVMEMGYLDYGGGVQLDPDVAGHGGHGRATGTTTTRGRRARSPTWSPIRRDRRTYGSSW